MTDWVHATVSAATRRASKHEENSWYIRFYNSNGDFDEMIEVKRYKEKARVIVYSGFELIPGNDLLSHAPTRAVPSAVAGLTSVFGMGTGVTLLLWPPGNLVSGVPPERLLYGAQGGSSQSISL